MPRTLAATFAAALVALGFAAACSNAGSGGSPCQGANPTSACEDCEQSACPTQFAQVQADCGALLACEAGCACSDVACTQACAAQATAACGTADSALQACLGTQCQATCSSTAGTPTGNCATLETCCPTLPSNVVEGCNTVVNANNDSICATQLSNFKAAGQCSGGSTTGSCATLQTCCDAIADANVKASCGQLVSSGFDSSCSAGLAGFQQAGYCP
jgi:hypothetical protein